MDRVIVPSEHVKRVIENTGPTTTSVSVIGESYLGSIDSPEDNRLDLSLSTDFNFLIIGQMTGQKADNDRKNLLNTIKWFCEAFPNDPDVGLIVKTNQGRATRIDRHRTEKSLREIVSHFRVGKYPKVYMLHGAMSESEMVGLYRRDDVKALVSLTRGEGFGLPLLEAAACNLPVIATNWSGHLDFLNLGKFLPINYIMSEIPDSRVDDRIFFKGMRWANPSEEDFKKKLYKFRHKYMLPQRWANELSAEVRKKFSPEAVFQSYDLFMRKEFGL